MTASAITTGSTPLKIDCSASPALTARRERLTARGIESRAVQLPSSNPDSAAAEGLTEDVAVVRDTIDAVSGPVVLAAHSYGGVPATWAAAEAEQLAELVYLAAFAIGPGTSMMQWMGGDFPPTWIHSPDVPAPVPPRRPRWLPHRHRPPTPATMTTCNWIGGWLDWLGRLCGGCRDPVPPLRVWRSSIWAQRKALAR
ncbi:hypothetical protein GCM10027075_72520 [Streptomyces heilongjiangensis]